MQSARRRTQSLERRLPLILTAVLVTTLGTALFFTYRALVSGAENAAHRGLTSAIQALVGTMETTARLREAQLRTAATAPAVRRLLQTLAPPTPAALEDAGKAVRALNARSPGESQVLLMDAAGNIVATWGADIASGLPALQRRVPPPPESQDRNAPWNGELFIAGGQLHTWTAIRIRDEMGQVAGTVASLRRSNPRQNITATLRDLTGEDVSLYVHNLRGGPWFTLDGRSTFASVPAAQDSLQLAERQGVGAVFFARQPIAGTPWGVVLEVPAESVRAGPSQATRRLALIVLLLALAGTIVTWRVARGVTHPLHQLAAAADELAKGRFTVPVNLDRDDELGKLAHSFDEMSRQIAVSRTELERRIADVERANRTKADFLAMMSHELRTPLNAIAGYTQIMEMGIHGDLTQEQRDALQRIGHSQRHLLHLIEDVLSFARIDAGHVEFELAEVPLAESIDIVLSMVEPQARAKRIVIDASRPDDDLTVYADREKLDQVMLNLVANAVKFTPADGRVEVGAEVLPERDEHGRELVQIRVSDTGPGVAPDHRATIFEPFVQGDRALNRPGEGVGLGLAISRDLTEGMGGRIALDSSRNGGASFVVTLLRHAPNAARKRHTRSMEAVPGGGFPA